LGELDAVASQHKTAHYYVAGSLGFVDAVTDELRVRGIALIEADVFKGLAD
jgi:hypothetical protein